MECGVASWRVRHCHGRHAIPSARWLAGPLVPSLCRPSPSRVPAGRVMKNLSRLTVQALAVAQLTNLKDQNLRSAWGVSKLDRRDHRAPDSVSPTQKAPRTTATVTFANDVEVIASTMSRSSPIEEPASPALLQPSWGFSLLLPHYDMSDTEPAAFQVAPPSYVLMVLFPLNGEVPCLRRRFRLFLYHRASILLVCLGRSLRRRFLPRRYL